MAWITHPSVVTGQVWKSTDENTYVKGNLDTLFPYDNTLQVAYSTSSTTLSKARATAALNFLSADSANTSLVFTGLIFARQGNSSLNWATSATSTSTFTVSNYSTLNSVKIQCGNSYKSGNIYYPSPYTNIPIVFVAAIGPLISFGTPNPTISYITSSYFGYAGGSDNIIWMSFGV